MASYYLKLFLWSIVGEQQNRAKQAVFIKYKLMFWF